MVQMFLSHSGEDHALVEPIHAQAHAIEVEVYLHELNSEPGTVNPEIGFALGQGLPVIPLVTAGVGSEQLAMLEGTEYIEFAPDQPQQALTKLTGPLHSMQAKQAVVHSARTLDTCLKSIATQLNQNPPKSLGPLLHHFVANPGFGGLTWSTGTAAKYYKGLVKDRNTYLHGAG